MTGIRDLVPCFLQLPRQLSASVAPPMPAQLVEVAPQCRICRHRQDERACISLNRAHCAYDALVVFEVLQDIKHANHVEAALERQLHGPALDEWPGSACASNPQAFHEDVRADDGASVAELVNDTERVSRAAPDLQHPVGAVEIRDDTTNECRNNPVARSKPEVPVFHRI